MSAKNKKREEGSVVRDSEQMNYFNQVMSVEIFSLIFNLSSKIVRLSSNRLMIESKAARGCRLFIKYSLVDKIIFCSVILRWSGQLLESEEGGSNVFALPFGKEGRVWAD